MDRNQAKDWTGEYLNAELFLFQRKAIVGLGIGRVGRSGEGEETCVDVAADKGPLLPDAGSAETGSAPSRLPGRRCLTFQHMLRNLLPLSLPLIPACRILAR